MYGYIPNLKEINQMDKTRNQLLLEQFEKQLRVEEKSNATILKYAHDVRNFLQNIKGTSDCLQRKSSKAL